MGKTTNKFSPEVRERAVRMGLEHEGDHPSRRAVIVSIAKKIGCTAQTLNERVKKTEVDAGARRSRGRLLCRAFAVGYGDETQRPRQIRGRFRDQFTSARESLLIPGSAEPSGLRHLVPQLSD
jgi:transposase-like protein